MFQCNARTIPAAFLGESEQPLYGGTKLPPPPPTTCVGGFRVSITPTLMPTVLRHMDMGSLTCAQIWVRARIHPKGGGGGGGGVRHKEVVDSEGHKSGMRPCPARGSNPGSSDGNSDALTTDLRPPWSRPSPPSPKRFHYERLVMKKGRVFTNFMLREQIKTHKRLK